MNQISIEISDIKWKLGVGKIKSGSLNFVADKIKISDSEKEIDTSSASEEELQDVFNYFIVEALSSLEKEAGDEIVYYKPYAFIKVRK